MTPKEKAGELLERMSFGKSYKDIGSGWSANLPNNEYYILCSLILIDEILKVACDVSDYDNSVTKSYWLEVKNEIQKL